MKKRITAVVAVLAFGSIASCGDQEPETTAAPTPTSATPSPAATSSSPTPLPAETSSTPTKDPEPIYTDAEAGTPINFSKGYPRIVRVSKISSRVDTESYFKGEKRAVQLAPGVWTNLPEGAGLQDAVADGPLIGLCASVKAFERKNPDVSCGGTCW